MLIIPAIDLKNGKCVRLVQGRMDAETVYADDPVRTAIRWADAGAELIHVVDLDGAAGGRLCHRPQIAQMVSAVRVPVQLGGGIRDAAVAESLLAMGVWRVVIGTQAVHRPAWLGEICRRHPGRVAVGLDARDGRIAVDGWARTTGIAAADLALQLEDMGVAAFIFTDIHRDGMQTGPNIEETRRLAERTRVPVIASGGVGGLDHIRALLPLEAVGVTGVIVGKALYSGAVEFGQAAAIARQTPGEHRCPERVDKHQGSA
ncbi:MAG: 1-(5-phosphoribosyl)-5-[(5-phosphoribosylamino)methylideneamino]imidazole-4-carboxamide isomerase [Desulfobacterales bacterium]|jgi:phosphoribosylformimino-5-aminoimidazole carboxamide ribotide isomerase|nr:1-(5-phosphoribosyl)-5-[(5-phosphoribosylamino)methylideneamino]imidazole-4-carboxamide isomerase [Desulfobacterales bacterium]